MPTNRTVIVWLVLGLIVLMMALCFRPPPPAPVPPKDQHTLDSLAITKPVFDSIVKSLAVAETVYVARVDTLRLRTTIVQYHADTLRLIADSLAAIAQWKPAYEARTAEADTLRVALVQKDTAFALEHRALLAADQQANILTNRLTVSEDLNTRLAADVKKAADCRVLWMRCPSRTRVAVVAVPLSLAIGFFAHR
jgi:hypothetical protein